MNGVGFTSDAQHDSSQPANTVDLNRNARQP